MFRMFWSGKVLVMLSASLFLFMAVGVAEKEKTDTSGQWKYVLENGGATITGCMEEPSGDLVIPGELDGYLVTGIGERTLDYLPLTSVTIPDSIVEILPYSFSYCRTLERIEVAPGNPAFESIDGVLFDKRQGMLVAYPYGRASETYVIPAGTRIIGENAFCFRERLTGITIPDSVTRIDHNAFRACVSLTGGIIIPGSIASIGESAFEGCSGLADIVLMEGITEIGEFAFTHCRGIAAISIPSSVGSIGYGAFIGCDRLTSLTLPASVTSIGDDAFADCPNLTLTVAESSYAHQYAEENAIPYVLAPSTTAETDDDLLIKQIDEFFTLPKVEIIEKFGADYTVVPAGPEGAYTLRQDAEQLTRKSGSSTSLFILSEHPVYILYESEAELLFLIKKPRNGPIIPISAK